MVGPGAVTLRAMRTTIRHCVVAGVAAVALVGCGGVSWDDAKKELTSSGATEETADCVIAELQANGFEASDFTDDNFDASAEAALSAATDTCLTASDITGMMTDAEIKEAVLEGFTSSGLTAGQAECVFDHMMANGFDPASAAIDPDAAVDLMTPAIEACA